MRHSMQYNRKNIVSRLLARCKPMRDESGNAIVEFTLLMAFALLPLVLGVSDLAPILYGSIEVADAARAGALAMVQNNGSSSNVYPVVTGDMPNVTTQVSFPPVSSCADLPGAGKGGANITIPTDAKIIVCPFWLCPPPVAQTLANGYTDKQDAETACGTTPLGYAEVIVSAPLNIPFNGFGVIPSKIPLAYRSVISGGGNF